MGNQYQFETLGDDKESTTVYHSDFRRYWKRTLDRDRTSKERECWIKYGEGKVIHVYDDLKVILGLMNLHPDNREENRHVFESYIETLKTVNISESPKGYTWYNTTISGINLRPGLRVGNNNLPDPVVMKGENTHGIIGGTTGSGKSVFLNNLILNLMAEYPPWELELYLADFKKVELSRYMNKYPAPHVRACAATSEIDYVVSLLRYIKDRMDDRQKLFARLGITDIENFRAEYKNLVIPRILFIVDEFQQLFLDATSLQKEIINDVITNLTRLGRAQGVHLLFASQDMSGALNQKQLSNFNIRFALHCDASVSADILGNYDAVGLRRGQVISKTKSTEGVVYTVPYAADSGEREVGEEDYFYRVLKEQKCLAEEKGYDYLDTQKFYDEDKQYEINKLEELLENPKVKSRRSFSDETGMVLRDQIYMSLVLGRKVVYSNDAYDIENNYIDYAKNRCILCLSSNNSDLAYFQKLLAINIKSMHFSEADDYTAVNRAFDDPYIYDLSPLVSTFYSEEERLKDFGIKEGRIYYRTEDLTKLKEDYLFRKLTLTILRDDSFSNAKERCLYLLEITAKDEGWAEDDVRNIMEDLGDLFSDLSDDDSNIIEFIEKKLNGNSGPFEDFIKDFLMVYYRHTVLGIRSLYKLFQPILVLITIGDEFTGKGFDWLREMVTNAMDYNYLMVFFSSRAVDLFIKQASNYIFVSGFDPKLYDDYLNIKMAAGENGIKFHAWIKNTNKHFAFKKYRCMMGGNFDDSIDFDSLLKEESILK